MGCSKGRKVFRAVGLKGYGSFDDYGKEVPKLAQQLLARKNEIKNASDIEIGIFEPKRDADHLEDKQIQDFSNNHPHKKKRCHLW